MVMPVTYSYDRRTAALPSNMSDIEQYIYDRLRQVGKRGTGIFDLQRVPGQRKSLFKQRDLAKALAKSVKQGWVTAWRSVGDESWVQRGVEVATPEQVAETAYIWEFVLAQHAPKPKAAIHTQ